MGQVAENPSIVEVTPNLLEDAFIRQEENAPSKGGDFHLQRSLRNPLPERKETSDILVNALETLPTRIEVKIPLRQFRIGTLISLAPNQVFVTDWNVSEDLPVTAGEVKLLWTEFAIANDRLTVRVTRIA